MTLTELNKMWSEFNNISINNSDEIEQDFYYWEKGTYRFDIWLWFDEKSPKGLIKFIY
ncbi:hypothetical protein QWY99_03285 [Flavobacterium branchiarum]|uniref:Uncharacterized protein n=1 Tax=Flavobacterium branchiarum TaxID=1114870 RepID=A0ABV5FPG3_9FLAO|nr:hypothetical protein [Flavobacterium branchiarum]MDN3672092.1 hypothetical protein [Flavobacterium branchiarum]